MRRNRSRSPVRATRTRSRSRSPPHRRRSPSPRRNAKVVIYTRPVDGRDRATLLSENFMIYDHLYPFRKAAQFILNAEHHSKQSQTDETIERFALEVLETAHSFFQPKPFGFDHFMEWFRGQRSIQRTILIIGLTDEESIDLLSRRGALVLDGPVHRISSEARQCRSFDG